MPPPSPPVPTTLTILGVDHSLQLVAEASQPAVLRAFCERVRPAALCVERPPHEYVQGGAYGEYGYEWRHVAVPWARERGVPVYPIDWVPPAEDQRLVWGVPDIEAPALLRPQSAVRSFLAFGAEAQHRGLFFAENAAARGSVATWYDQARRPGEGDFPRRLGLYRTFLQAMRIKAVCHQHPGATVLVVVGYFHKGDIELVLAETPALWVVQPSAFGHPTPEEAEAQTRLHDLFAVLSFNLLGVQAREGVVDWDWLGRVLERVERGALDASRGRECVVGSSAEVLLLRTRFRVLTGRAAPEEALRRYEAAGRRAGPDEAFTFTGVVDGSRLDSYYDPFGNLRVGERALLEQARAHYKLGRAPAARALRDRLLAGGRLSLVQRVQLEGYWDEYVARTA